MSKCSDGVSNDINKCNNKYLEKSRGSKFCSKLVSLHEINNMLFDWCEEIWTFLNLFLAQDPDMAA